MYWLHLFVKTVFYAYSKIGLLLLTTTSEILEESIKKDQFSLHQVTPIQLD